MRYETFAWIGLSLGCGGVFWIALDFRETQEQSFQKANREKHMVQEEVRLMREDLAFLESHQKDIHFLRDKGWFVPKNRLVAGEFLEKICPLLKKVSYRFDPETVKSFTDGRAFKVTQITLKGESSGDVEMYTFVDRLLKDFPGILIPREVTLARDNEAPPLMRGKFIFDWVSMGEK